MFVEAGRDHNTENTFNTVTAPQERVKSENAARDRVREHDPREKAEHERNQDYERGFSKQIKIH